MNDDDLYRDELLDHADSSPHRGHLEVVHLAAELENPLCGDHVRLELELDPQNRICQIRFDGQGCVISQAATSILTEAVEGLPLDEARQLSADMLLERLKIRLTPMRLKCGLLGWRVLQRALAQADARPAAAAR